MAFSVDVSVHNGYPKETRERDRFTAEIKYLCAWADRLTLRDELIAFPGHEYNYSSCIAYCTAVATEPYGRQGVSGGLATYPLALVTARYGTPSTSDAQQDPGGSPGDMISEDWEPELEFMQAYGANLRWNTNAGDPIDPDAAPGIRIEKGQYTFTRHHLVAPPATIESLIGTCNNAPVTTKLLGRTFAAETLLARAPRINIVSDSAGNRKFTLNWVFSYQAAGWNKWFNPNVGAFQPIYFAGGSRMIAYPLANYAGL